MLALLWISTALAADWLALQGTETRPDPPAVRPWGFAQALGEGIVGGEPATGLIAEGLAPYEGERASFNRVGSGDSRFAFSVRRARLGLRGAVPGTQEKVAWMVAAEFGQNRLTRVHPVVLTDASLTFSYIPYVKIRAGQFKLPLGEEALEMNPLAAEFVNFSNVTGQLLLESPIEGGAWTDGASGFRDIGIQLFDSVPVAGGAISYAAMVSNGRRGKIDLDDTKDVTVRLSWAPWVGGKIGEIHREELSFFGFWQQGRRTVDDVEMPRIRRGGGIQLEKAGVHARVEIIDAKGTIELPPTFPGQPVGVSAEGRATGGYVFVHYRRGPFGGGLRYDELRRLTDSAPDLRIFRTVTADLQLEPTPKVRVLLDWEHRWLRAPEGSADVQTIVATMGDRVSLLGTVAF